MKKTESYKMEQLSRREFINKLGRWLTVSFGILLVLPRMTSARIRILTKGRERMETQKQPVNPKGTHNETRSQIYICKNGSPEENVAKVIEMMGGIETIIDKDDIVIIKPNAQWRRHGITNTNTIKGLIDLVLRIPDFTGEIIIAENHHDDPDNARGWTTDLKNGDFNLNELVEYYNDQGYQNVSKYHWHDGGPNPNYLQFRAGDGGIVSGPEEGDGYVWSDVEYRHQGRKTKMTYPIFTSTYSGTTIDFRRGAWENGHYTNQPVKFINMSTINHHSSSFGVTASIKNYLGVVDMSCGEQGPSPPGYYNFHYISIGWSKDSALGRLLETVTRSKQIRRSKFLTKAIRKVGPKDTGALGGAVGHFMKTIRQADLNIIAAEYAGHEGRHDPPAHTKTVLASTDPVALDYYAGKYVLLPLGGSKKVYNDPDNLEGPFRQYLEFCHAEGIGTLDETKMFIQKYDFINGKDVIHSTVNT